jgi:hypothetical protein
MTAELLDDLAQTFRVFFDNLARRDDLGVAGSSLSGTCSSRGFILAVLGRDQRDH